MKAFGSGGSVQFVLVKSSSYDVSVWVPFQVHGNKVLLLQGNGSIVELSLPSTGSGNSRVTDMSPAPVAERVNQLIRQGKFKISGLGQAPDSEPMGALNVLANTSVANGKRWSAYLDALPDSPKKTALQVRLNQILRGEITGGIFSGTASVALTIEAGGPAYRLGLIQGMLDISEGSLNMLALQPAGTIKVSELRRERERIIEEARKSGIDLGLKDGDSNNLSNQFRTEDPETRALHDRGRSDAQAMLLGVAGGAFSLKLLLPKASLRTSSNAGTYLRLKEIEIGGRRVVVPIDSRDNIIPVRELQRRGGRQWEAYQRDIKGVDQRLILPGRDEGIGGNRGSSRPTTPGSPSGGGARTVVLEGRRVTISATGVVVSPTMSQGALMRQMASGSPTALLFADGLYTTREIMKTPSYYKVLTELQPGEQIRFTQVPVGPNKALVDIAVGGTNAGGRSNGGTLSISVKRSGASDSDWITLHPRVGSPANPLEIDETIAAAVAARNPGAKPTPGASGEQQRPEANPRVAATSYDSFEKLRAQLGADSVQGSAARAWVDGAWDLQQRLKDPKNFDIVNKLKAGETETYSFGWNNGAGQTIPLTVTVTGVSAGVVAITVASPWGAVTMMPELGRKGAPLTMINDAVRDLERVRGQGTPAQPARDSNIPSGAKDCSQEQLVARMPAGTRDNVIGWNNAFRNETSAAQRRSGQEVWQSIRGGAVETFTPPNSGEFRVGPGEKGVANTYTIYVKDPKGQWWKSTFNGMPSGSNPQDGAINLWSPDGTGFGRRPSTLGGAAPTNPAAPPNEPSNAPIKLLNSDIARRGSNDPIFKDLVWLASDGRALTANAMRGGNSNDPPVPLREGGLPVSISKGASAGTVKLTWHGQDGARYEYSPVVKPDGTLDRGQLPSAVVNAIPKTQDAASGIPPRDQRLNVSQSEVMNAGPRDVAKLRLREAIDAYAGGQRGTLPGGVRAVERVRGALDFIDPSTGIWTSVKFRDNTTDVIVWDRPQRAQSQQPQLQEDASFPPPSQVLPKPNPLQDARDWRIAEDVKFPRFSEPTASDWTRETKPDKAWERLREQHPDVADTIDRAVRADPGVVTREGVMERMRRGATVLEAIANMRDGGLGIGGQPPGGNNNRPTTTGSSDGRDPVSGIESFQALGSPSTLKVTANGLEFNLEALTPLQRWTFDRFKGDLSVTDANRVLNAFVNGDAYAVYAVAPKLTLERLGDLATLTYGLNAGTTWHELQHFFGKVGSQPGGGYDVSVSGEAQGRLLILAELMGSRQTRAMYDTIAVTRSESGRLIVAVDDATVGEINRRFDYIYSVRETSYYGQFKEIGGVGLNSAMLLAKGVTTPFGIRQSEARADAFVNNLEAQGLLPRNPKNDAFRKKLWSEYVNFDQGLKRLGSGENSRAARDQLDEVFFNSTLDSLAKEATRRFMTIPKNTLREQYLRGLALSASMTALRGFETPSNIVFNTHWLVSIPAQGGSNEFRDILDVTDQLRARMDVSRE